MKVKIIGLILFSLLLLGCTSQVDNTSDSNKTVGLDTNDANIVSNDLNRPNENGLIFCQRSQENKFYYEEKYYTDDMIPGVTTQNYQKQTLSELKYFEKLKDDPNGVGTWGVATKDEFIVYSNADGECTAMSYDSTYNPFLMEQPIYYLIQFSGETKQIGGSEIGWKLKQSEDLSEGLDTTIVTLGDYISQEYCIPLVFDVNSFDFASHAEKVSFTKDFPDSVFDIPLECQNAPVTHISNLGGGVIEDSFEEDSDINYSSDGNLCIEQCEEMRIICEAKGQEVTSDGTGCYDPNIEDYQRHCEYVCWGS